jgi:hypothetical protein
MPEMERHPTGVTVDLGQIHPRRNLEEPGQMKFHQRRKRLLHRCREPFQWRIRNILDADSIYEAMVLEYGNAIINAICK